MAIVYVRWGEEGFWEFADLSPGRDVLFFDPRMERSSLTIGDRYRRLDPTWRTADLVLCRGSDPAIVDQVEQDAILPTILRSAPVQVLTGPFDGRFLQVRFTRPQWSPPPSFYPSLEELRQAELTAILDKNAAIFRGEDTHYGLPSGLHAGDFVRLGEAAHDPADVARLVDWILPYASPNVAFLGDNGSIVAVLLCLQHQALVRFGWHVAVDVLDHYPLDVATLRRAITDFRGALDPRSKIIFLLGVNSSGTVAERFKRLEAGRGEVLTICDTSSGSRLRGDVLVSYPVERWPVDDSGRCERCDDYGALIPIDPRAYEERPTLDVHRIPMSPKRAGSQQRFWEAARRTQAVRLHYDAHGGGTPTATRHFPIFLDVRALLSDAEFHERALAELRGIPVPELVLIPEHETTDSLVDLADEAYQSEEPAIGVHRVRAGKFSQELVTQLEGATKRILIMDDAIVTGATLGTLRRAIYRVTKRVKRNTPVSAFAILALPRDDGPERMLGRTFRDSTGTQASWVERVYLPGPRECAWCDERNLLRVWLDRLQPSTRQLAQRRVAALESSLGRENVLLVQQDDDSEIVESFFGNLDQVTGFAAAAATVQEIRLEMRKKRARSSIYIVDIPAAIEGYYDDVLLAAVLRTCRQGELRSTEQDALVDDVLGRVGLGPSKCNLYELGWAAALGRIPCEGVNSLLLRHPESHSLELSLVQELIHLNAG